MATDAAEQPRNMITTAKISWLESGDPYSEQFQDFYFSTDGGFAESEYVFLKQNNFPQRFSNLAHQQINTPFQILETGFGTGLNFLLTVFHWLQVPNLKCTLEFTSVEKFPLSKNQLERIYTSFCHKQPQLSFICTELLEHYPDTLSNINSTNKTYLFDLFDGRIRLILLFDDAQIALNKLLPEQAATIDACYLDGFSPAKNPEMWHNDLFNIISTLCRPEASISTFTSAGFVRRGLIAAGFELSKVPGLGKKREILRGTKPLIP